MSRFRDEIANQKYIVRIQWGFIAILTLVTLYAMHGWKQAPEEMSFYTPPDLRVGGRVKAGDVPPSHVYAFALYVWQQVNRWQSDGQTDYGKQIYLWQSYLTPACRATLEADMNRKANAGELTRRTRSLQEASDTAYDDSRVKPRSHGVWVATIDTEISETVAGTRVKDVRVRYPLRVVRYDVDRNANPFGLGVDCYEPGTGPSAIKPAEKPAAQATPAESAGKLPDFSLR